MSTSFEERIARINAKNGEMATAGSGSESLSTDRGRPDGMELGRDDSRPSAGRLIAMFGATFVLGLIVIAGGMMLLP